MIQDVGCGLMDNAWRVGLAPQPSDLLLAFEGRRLAVRTQGEGYAFLRMEDAYALGLGVSCGKPSPSFAYLFSFEGMAVWGRDLIACGEGLSWAQEACRREHIELLDLGELRQRADSNAQMLAVYTAWHLHEWYRTNRFCGACGGPLAHAADERALQCPSCGNRVYPRINPAVIVGVIDPVRGRIVLTRYARGRGVSYDALIAGFAEIGETFEQCVAREVREEVGLAVKNIRYAGSQPWGIASDLLAGFWCEVDGDATLHMDASELSRAIWAAPADIVGQPDNLSLTNWMMCAFRDRGPQVADRVTTAARPGNILAKNDQP